MFENYKKFETTLAGRPFVVETGKMCGLSNGSCLVRYGETVVLCNATMSNAPRVGIDFFPLSVDFEEKLYSVGNIPGSFMRREGRPSEKAVLTGRVVDRPIRPLFPKDMRNDVAVVMTVMSVDEDCSPEVAGMIGTSIALSISDIPWKGPIAGIFTGLCGDEIVLCPGAEQRARSDLQLTVAATRQKVVMIEAGANEVSEEMMQKAIKASFDEIVRVIDFIETITREIGKRKIEFISMEVDRDLFESIKSFCIEDIKSALDTDDKNVRDERLKPIIKRVHENFDPTHPDGGSMIDECIYKLQKYVVRRWLLDEGKRVDGRGIDEMRPLAAEVGLLSRVHGTGMFTRGQTQVLTTVTLGSLRDAQILDGIDGETSKRYMHHYNFPPYSVGEARGIRAAGRREIGHGALAERALLPMIPPETEFPYAIRLVSEILSSNGSTSQGAICGSTLALMDAGVPIKAPIAGISCGLITEGERFMTMVDIQGVEDFFGDMDFKVAGSKKGITAIQMDLKNDGLTFEIIEQAFTKCKKARYYILDEIMLKAIPQHRSELSQYAPKMVMLKIDPDKIRDVIGKGGKVIQEICANCNAKIDIEDDGTIYVLAVAKEDLDRAVNTIKMITEDPEVGAIYKGRVTRLMNFGAFIEIAPGKEGLCHISKLEKTRVEKVEDVVNVGDEVFVKITEIDSQGRINLSRKDALGAMNK